MSLYLWNNWLIVKRLHFLISKFLIFYFLLDSSYPTWYNLKLTSFQHWQNKPNLVDFFSRWFGNQLRRLISGRLCWRWNSWLLMLKCNIGFGLCLCWLSSCLGIELRRWQYSYDPFMRIRHLVDTTSYQLILEHPHQQSYSLW